MTEAAKNALPRWVWTAIRWNIGVLIGAVLAWGHLK